MIRTTALSVLVAFSLALAAPAFAPAPAFAADGARVEGALPSLPWTKIAQWALRNALTLIIIVEELWRDMQGAGNNPPPEQPPPQTPSVAPDPGLELAFALPGAVRSLA